eukprot:TRINITY_DN9590_c0_g1_i1.p1 TRINITY_DN9590_c0_g1~~TRINITY_DN9590_c0_g1_i1.p1  ORF type:complete len:301 (+),score=46.87 TRINITY_DN9590_c0_g1_i1:2-904(+)
MSVAKFSFASPIAPLLCDLQYKSLLSFFRGKKSLTFITGAGCSTDSGLPDYRSPNGSYSKGHKPMMHQDFLKNEHSRKRFWLGAWVGWDQFSCAKPNSAHIAIRNISLKTPTNLITQNVDGLHQLAGSQDVVELHGSMRSIQCLSCKQTVTRDHFQQRIHEANFDWMHFYMSHSDMKESRPDGDTNVSNMSRFGKELHEFEVPECESCGGIMKPRVIFFGDNVPTKIKDVSTAFVANSDGIVVAGTTLQTYSAFRLTNLAKEKSIPFVVLNIGQTRADGDALMHIQSNIGGVLDRIASDL